MDKRVIKFLVFTFLLTFGCWGAIILANQFEYLVYGTPISMIIYLTGGLSPTIVAYYYLKKCNRVDGIKDFFKKSFSIKQPWQYYILILVLLTLYFILPFTMGIVTYSTPIYLLPILLISNIIGGGLEELGWRYILQHELEKKYSFIVSTIIVSIVWAVWHLPLFYIVGTSQQQMLDFWTFSILVVGFSFMLGAIYHITKSLWLCILCHTLINSLNACFLFLDKVNIVQSCLIAGLLVVSSYISIILMKKKQYRVNNLILK